LEQETSYLRPDEEQGDASGEGCPIYQTFADEPVACTFLPARSYLHIKEPEEEV